MRTVLFGLDGATFTVLDRLVEQGLMPHLAEFYRRGARGRLESTALPLTPQAWTSLATGQAGGRHGISDWVRFRWGPQGNYGHINNSRDIHAETIWHYASRSGRRVTVLNYFGLAPPQPLNGHSMPGFTSGRHLRRSSWPADLFSRLEQVPDFDVKTLGLDLEIERRVLQEMPPDEWREWISHHLARDRIWFGVLEHLMRTEPADLSAIVFDGVDKLQHLAWRLLDPALAAADPSDWDREITGMCHDYFRQIDRFLGRVLELVGAWGRVFVVSDHGFTASHEIFYVNKFLADHGYLVWKGSQSLDTEEACATAKPEHDANAIDLERSRAFAFTPSANGIFLQVPPADYHRVREELAARLLALRGDDGGQIVTAVKRREDYFPGPYQEDFPDLTLDLRDHGFVSVLNSAVTVRPRRVPMGTHHPEGVLLALGPGIRGGVETELLSILDVAPLLAHSLGLEIPADYQGEFPRALYDEAYLASDPPRRAAAAAPSTAPEQTPTEPAPTGGDELEADEESAIYERLRSLGYIE